MGNELVRTLITILIVLGIALWLRTKDEVGELEREERDGAPDLSDHKYSLVDSAPLEYRIVGVILLQKDKQGPFVIDPVSKEKTWVKEKDEIYEDDLRRLWEIKKEEY